MVSVVQQKVRDSSHSTPRHTFYYLNPTQPLSRTFIPNVLYVSVPPSKGREPEKDLHAMEKDSNSGHAVVADQPD